MPRYKLATNQEMFDLLFYLIDKLNSAGQQELWSLIMSLRTNPRVYMNIVGLSGLDELVSPETSVFKQLYCLQIMFSLVQDYSV